MGRRGPQKKVVITQEVPESEWLDIPPPEVLKPQAIDYWNQVLSDMQRFGQARVVDRHAIAMLANAMYDYERASKLVEQEGEVCYSEKGSPYQHPAVGQKNKAADQIRQWLKECRMTWAAAGETPPKQSNSVLNISKYVVN